MIDPQRAEEVIRAVVAAKDAFLVDYHIGSDNRITVHVGHRDGISLQMLSAISRAVEAELDRETEDFELEVSSPGIGSAFKVKEQYEANVGRLVKVTTTTGEVLKGDMAAFTNDTVTLKWKERVPKKVGKGKETVTMERSVPLNEIKETRLEIRF